MTLWEYKTIVLSLSVNIFDEELNRLGQDGWRMVGTDIQASDTIQQQRRFIFMRPSVKREPVAEETPFEPDEPEEADVREIASAYLRGPLALEPKKK